MAALARRRPARWAALAGPLAAGWLVATFVALTMQGWWFGGRQVVVVLPLAAFRLRESYGPEGRLDIPGLGLISAGLLALVWGVINGNDPCAWGYARLIWGLAALPESARTREVERTLRRGVEFLLSYKLERGRYPTATEPSYLWRQLSFPLFYQADVLFVLRAIDAAGGLDDPRAQPAIAWLLARQDERGRWAGRAPYADRMASRVDASKWVTLQVLTILKHAFSPDENGS